MIELDLDPAPKTLRRFGVLLAAFVPLAGGLVHWKLDAPQAAAAVWAIGGALVAAYLVARPLRRWVYIGLLRATYPIGWLVSHSLLAAVYYLLLTPIGLALRLLKRNPLERTPDRSRPTYWVRRRPTLEVRRYFRQF